MTTNFMQWNEPLSEFHSTPTIKNHSVTHHDGYLYCFGGYDGRRNHMTLWVYSIREKRWKTPKACGAPPPGRNGHTATFSTDKGQIIIIGGWLGSGPLAASDTHVLDISEGPESLRWVQPNVKGTPPGPCNMHSADYIENRKEVYVFRGGNGREYLNDLHALHVDTYEWRKVHSTGKAPHQRANHSSAVLNETNELFIFGGWNGKARLNDIHILDTNTSVWSAPLIGGVLPHPRAGMTLTALRGRLFLFGGSGTSSKCFDDLQIFDRKEMAWLDVSLKEENLSNNTNPNAMDYNYTKSPMSNNAIQKSNEYEMHSRTDWEYSLDNQQQHNTHANPNDEESKELIILKGHGPDRRAGHTATAVNRYIYVFGGSCGSDYLSDFFVLDTDPPPKAKIIEPNSFQLFNRRLKHFFNDEEFSDVIFLVEGKEVYGHRLILCLISDCFRAMFTNGFAESSKSVVPIPNCTYAAFITMMEYIYSGQPPSITIDEDNMDEGIREAVELLELADQFFLDHLKQVCEGILQNAVCSNTYEFLLRTAEETNARQLENICLHFERNQDNINEENEARGNPFFHFHDTRQHGLYMM